MTAWFGKHIDNSRTVVKSWRKTQYQSCMFASVAVYVSLVWNLIHEFSIVCSRSRTFMQLARGEQHMKKGYTTNTHVQCLAKFQGFQWSNQANEIFGKGKSSVYLGSLRHLRLPKHEMSIRRQHEIQSRGSSAQSTIARKYKQVTLYVKVRLHYGGCLFLLTLKWSVMTNHDSSLLTASFHDIGWGVALIIKYAHLIPKISSPSARIWSDSRQNRELITGVTQQCFLFLWHTTTQNNACILACMHLTMEMHEQRYVVEMMHFVQTIRSAKSMPKRNRTMTLFVLVNSNEKVVRCRE